MAHPDFEGCDSTGTTPGDFPTPDEPNQVLYAVTAAAFTKETPLTSDEAGWLVNDFGHMRVIG